MTSFKPMLAATCDPAQIAQLRFPVLATPKIDGIRCIVVDGKALSRTLKLIPNRFIQTLVGRPEFNGLDGELLVGNSFQQSTSGIMSERGAPDFTYYVFDKFHPTAPYVERVEMLNQTKAPYPRFTFLFPVEINSLEELEVFMVKSLELGFEGTMIRSPRGLYKQGRATFNEGWLTKLKPFEDAEATVIGFEERMHNGNEATTNLLGRTERSSHRGNMIPMGTLGALQCENQTLWPGQTFNIGTGFDDRTRAEIWANLATTMGRTVKFKYQKIGTVDKPRIPVFLGFRDPDDI